MINLSKLEKGDISKINLQSTFVFQTEYKGVSQRHFLKPRRNEAGFVLSAIDSNGVHRTITTLENPYAGHDTGAGNRWAERAVSDLLESMYQIITPAQDRKKREFLAKIKSVPIIEYANMLGFTVIKRGHYYSTKEHDSLSIDPESNYYWRNSQIRETGKVERGSIIDFAMYYDPSIHNKGEAFSKLAKMVNFTEPFLAIQRPQKDKGPVELEIPSHGDTMKHAIAYLEKTRKIDHDIVQWFIDNKRLYEDNFHNCVFVSFDKNGKENFICKRGTNTYKRFVGDAEGCDYNTCYFINNHAKTLISSEAVIDEMSIMSLLKSKGRDLKDYNYHALSGCDKWESVLYILEHNPNIDTLVLGYDNDDTGLSTNLVVKKALEEKKWPGKIIDFIPEKEKDWNKEWQTFFEPPKEVVQLDNLEKRAPEKQEPPQSKKQQREIYHSRELGR